MKGELESLCSNIVWIPIEAPKGIKTHTYKLVYKSNKLVSGRLKTYMNRVVAKGYSSKHFFDYRKPFHQ